MHQLNKSREIIDESDVFIDVHKAIRRMAPAPRTRAPKGEILTDTSQPAEQDLRKAVNRSESNTGGPRKFSAPELSGNPRLSFLLHRRSSGNIEQRGSVPSHDDVKQHLKHLGPSNAAKQPKTTRINTVKIKPGIITEDNPSPKDVVVMGPPAHQGGVGEGILENAGREASDGVLSLAVGYGTMSIQNRGQMSPKSGQSKANSVEEDAKSSKSNEADDADEHTRLLGESASRPPRRPSVSTLGSLQSRESRSPSPPRKRSTARSGSISENVVDRNGVKKIVLETTSSSDSEGKLHDGPANGVQVEISSRTADGQSEEKKSSKKKRKKRGKKKKHAGESSSESRPLLG
jgi:metal transporter CNNM